VDVEVDALYDLHGNYSVRWQQEKVKGTISLSVNGRKQTFDFYDTCVASLDKCGPHVRVARWEEDTSGYFKKLYLDPKGVSLFYPARGAVDRADQVDPRTINVRLQVRP
jgi:hypothetical protein